MVYRACCILCCEHSTLLSAVSALYVAMPLPSVEIPLAPYEGASHASAIGDLPLPPKFASKQKERQYIKFRLAQAFRIFGQLLRSIRTVGR